MADPNSDIKTMKLYNNVERIFNELKELGYKSDDALDVDVVCQFDQYHYNGVDTVQEVIDGFKLSESSKVLDVGSGIGGPARYLSHKSSCFVTALEIQKDLDETGIQLTSRCGLADKVTHICGDLLDIDLGTSSFDLIVSWLVFLHIPDKKKLFKKCMDHLKPNGQIFIEDFYEIEALTDKDKAVLEEAVFCSNLPNQNDYVRDLQDGGFTDIRFEDVTSQWTAFVDARCKDFCSKKERHVRVHGEAVYNALEYFYKAVVGLFQGGHVGGARITATRKD